MGSPDGLTNGFVEHVVGPPRSNGHFMYNKDTDPITETKCLQSEDHKAPKGKLTVPLIVTALVSAFGSSFPHGWNTGVLNAPQQLIKDFLNGTFTDRFGYAPDLRMLNFIWPLSVAIYLVGGCAGALSVGWMADKFGRKRALLINHSFIFLSSILFGLCKVARSFEMLILARLVVGFGCGAGSGLVPMFLTEISPVNIRGAMGVVHQFFLTCGILFSQIFGLRQILGSEMLWPLLLAATAFPCIVSCAVLPFFPESPRYLYVNKKDTESARAALQKLRGRSDVQADLDEMEREVQHAKEEPEWTFKKLFTSRALRLPLALVLILSIAQQLSGINVVFYYAVDVFEKSGIPKDKTQYAVLATGATNVIMTAISVPLMERGGRRILLLSGMAMMVFFAAVITVALNLQHTVTWMSYISIICIIGTVVGFSIGLGSIPQFIGAELFKQGPRPPAMSIAGLLNWLANFMVAIGFPPVEMVLGAYSFIIFIVTTTCFGLFIWWKLPETKNKSYEEIYAHFQGDRHAELKAREFDEINVDVPLTTKQEEHRSILPFGDNNVQNGTTEAV